MNSDKVELFRKEYMLLDWFASVGGVGSIALACAKIFSMIKSPHLFVTSALIE